jgi:quercetin dioxygenase-like cupin family protein
VPLFLGEAEQNGGEEMTGFARFAAVAWCVLAAIGAIADAQSLEAVLPDGVDQVVHRGGDIGWGPCPPGPLAGEGCRMAVLEGDPKAEQLFTFRIRTTEPFVLPPHTHPRNERVTVIEGAVHVGFGGTVDRQASTRFEAGDFYVNRAGAVHFVWSDEPVTLQLTGIGPWAIHPLVEAAAPTH